MKEEVKRLRLDAEGLVKFEARIQQVETELANVRMYKGKEAIHQGDNWHDNPTLYQTELTEMSLMRTLAEMREQLKNIEIVEKLQASEVVDVGDVVTLEMIFAPDDKEQSTFKLVGSDGDLRAEIPEVSINSPMGSAILGKRVGDRATYQVNNNTINVDILSKMELTDTHTKTLEKK